ncbi:MAG: hypothetical protein ISP82_07685, partial [Candidatus Poseidoniaceae archaeon]|nr:hypothetical protein [Candidatus Poseidoniaceae archaeon]
LPEIFSEFMGAASDAGFELIIGQVNSGSSNIYTHYYEDISPQTIKDVDNMDVDVWSRTNDVTIRHGGLFDGIFMTEWLEQSFGSEPTGFDVDIEVGLQNMLNIDITYVEYFNNDNYLVGADMAFSISTSSDLGFSFDAEIQGNGDNIPVDFDLDMSYGFSITNSQTEWRLNGPSPVYTSFSSGSNGIWDCNIDDDCGTIDSDFNASIDYSFSVSGIPTEDFGLDEGEFDIEVSDMISKTNLEFNDHVEDVNVEFSMGDSMVVDLGNGPSTNVVACDSCPPGNPLMFLMMGEVIANSGQTFAEEIADEFVDNLDQDILDIFGIDDTDDEDEQEEENDDLSDVEVGDKLQNILDSMADSNLQNVMTTFGENLQTRMDEIETLDEFPYTNGMFAPLWSSEHATVVGVGLYVEDDNGSYVIAGPNTQGYGSIPPTQMSLRYLTGAEAMNAASSIESADELNEIFDVDLHDINQIAEDLEAAGVDTGDIEFISPTDDSSNTDGTEVSEAEEKAESDGLLPFASPISVLATIALAGFIIANGKDES